MSSQTLDALENRWQDACRVLFGEESCGLEECSPWLRGFIEPLSFHRSSISGKEVISAPTDYCGSARWTSFEEIDFVKKFEPLEIDDLKDIDSVISAVSERLIYSGNIVFGKSGFIEQSSNINDSFYVSGVRRLGNSRYVAYCTIGKLNESCFGCNGVGESAFCVRCSRSFRNKRCFEAWMCQNCADCHYCAGLNGCSGCMFSFNVRKKRNLIGNLELPASKYAELRGKLRSEMAQKLKKSKSLPSLIELIKGSKAAKPSIKANSQKDEDDKGKIEAAFLRASGILLGKPLEGGIDSYAGWLSRHTRPMRKCTSAASGRDIYTPDAVNYDKLPRDRLLSEAEALALGEIAKMSEEEVSGLTLENVSEPMGKIAFFNVDLFEGTNSNNIECAVCMDSKNNYRNSLMFYSKNSAYNFWPRDSDHIFGCDSPFSSSFSMNCYSCTNQVRSFEIDCCGYCSDAYFCHNCENVHDSMFCFNTKNKRNAIGNAELPAPQYRKIKELLVGQMHDELSSKKDLRWDIYNIACRRP